MRDQGIAEMAFITLFRAAGPGELQFSLYYGILSIDSKYNKIFPSHAPDLTSQPIVGRTVNNERPIH
jgi:hypothetical protein